jgi:hypothetical protein
LGLIKFSTSQIPFYCGSIFVAKFRKQAAGKQQIKYELPVLALRCARFMGIRWLSCAFVAAHALFSPTYGATRCVRAADGVDRQRLQ